MKKRLGLWIGLGVTALVIVAAVVLGVIFLWPQGSSAQIILEQESYTVEYGEMFIVPLATCTTGEEVTVTAYDAEGYEVYIDYGTITFDKGENKLVFTAGSVTKEVPVLCQDTTPPEAKYTFVQSAAVGHWYYLPEFTVSDISGVDRSKSKIELFKGEETTAVASEVGQRVRIEEADSYTLRISAVDTDGNELVENRRINVIVRPESEVIQDFSEDLQGYYEFTWGSGNKAGPIFKWYEEYDGREGVLALGSTEKDYMYLWWTDLGMDNLDLVGCTGFTFKLKGDKNTLRQIWIKPQFQDTVSINITPTKNNEWVDVYVSLVNTEIADPSAFTIGLAIATNGFNGTDECVWIDEVIAHYTPYPEYTVTVENGTIDYPYDTVPEGRIVTVTHDDSLTPEGTAFMYYKANGERVYGSTFAVTENMDLKAFYTDLVAEEKSIPNGAVMVNDFSGGSSAVRDTNYGNGNKGISEWYRTYYGRANVVSFGLLKTNTFEYIRWNNILPNNFDYSAYTHITFRMYVIKDVLRSLGVGTAKEDKNVNLLSYMDEDQFGVWTDVTVNLNKVGDFLLTIANTEGAYGEFVLLDQVYVSVQPDYSKYEKSIPAGAVMVEDFSEKVPVNNHPNWGTGKVGQSKWYQKLDDVYGVLAFGIKDGKEIKYTKWYGFLPNRDKFDYSKYTHITYRLKVNKEAVRAISLCDDTKEFGILKYIDASNEWIDVTVPLKDVPGFYLWISNVEGYSGEMVWLDQVFVSKQGWTVTVEGGTMDYKGDAVPNGTKITLTHDTTQAPKDCYFDYWIVNGERIDGNTIVVDYDLTIRAVYKTTLEELPIPAHAVMVEDFSERVVPVNRGGWGSGKKGVTDWYAAKDGVAGVLGMGFQENNDWMYLQWDDILPADFDYSGFTHVTFRMKVRKDVLRMFSLCDGNVEDADFNILKMLPSGDAYVDVLVPLSNVPGFSLRIANTQGASGEVIWIDQVFVSVEEWQIDITGGTTDQADNKASDGTTVTFTPDASAAPADCEFDYWTVDGMRIEGNSYVIHEDITVKAVYKTNLQERPIPEGAVMVRDFSELTNFTNDKNYGSGAVGTSEWWAAFKGVAGVQRFGVKENTVALYTQWNDLIPSNFDLSQYTHITFRMWAFKDAWRSIALGNGTTSHSLLQYVNTSNTNTWIDVTIPISDIPGFLLQVSNNAWQSGGYLCFDQIYVSVGVLEPDEPTEPTEPDVTEPTEPDVTEPSGPSNEYPIPEGAVMVEDFSENVNPTVITSFGTPQYAASGWRSEFKDAHGVQAFGFNDSVLDASDKCGYVAWKNVIPSGFDYSSYTYITFRVYAAVDSLRVAAFCNDSVTANNNVKAQLVAGQWNYISIPVSELAGYGVYLANVGWHRGDMFYIDQVYVTSGTEAPEIPTEPEVTEPDVTEPEVTEPDVTEPEVTEPDVTEPSEPTDSNEWAIPEGAVMVRDFSEQIELTNDTVYGTGAVGTSTWAEEFQGRYGVLRLGVKDNKEPMYTQWNDLIPSDFDLSQYTHITFRMWIFKAAWRTIALTDGTTSYSLLKYVDDTNTNQWIDVTIPISDIPGFLLQVSNTGWYSGGYFCIDQIYVTKESKEVAIPEGAAMVRDFSEAIELTNDTVYGTGAVGTSVWAEEFKGRYGVLRLGVKENTAAMYTQWNDLIPSDFDLSQYTHITFRMWVFKDAWRTIALTNGTTNHSLLQYVNTSNTNTWIDVTIPISDIPGFLLQVSNTAWQSGGYLCFDQIYVQ